MAYTLAGVDCIDIAADPAVISTAKIALDLATSLAKADGGKRSYTHAVPWLMVSLNDGEDPHFRKAEFNAATCPSGCARPCEQICPAQAIVFEAPAEVARGSGLATMLRTDARESLAVIDDRASGVLSDRCYGCGRCLPICPVQQIVTHSYQSTPAAMVPFIMQAGIDAIEIHTQIGHIDEFCRLWAAIEPWLDKLKLIAISCPDGDGLLDYLRALYESISPLPCALMWQLDGRPMSGDIGIGTTRAAVKLGQKVLTSGLPGYIQLAGGTNHHTVPKLKALNLLHPRLQNAATTAPSVAEPLLKSDQALDASQAVQGYAHDQATAYVAGVAYGSYARTLLMPILNQLDAIRLEMAEPEARAVASGSARSPLAIVNPAFSTAFSTTERSQPLGLEDAPDLLWQAVGLARSLVSQLKAFNTEHPMRLDL
jgi:Fe-S-cluster-containing hydrogenase component 2